MWLRSEYGDDSSVVAADPSRYTLEFHSDGTIGIGADCNRVVGTYAQEATRLTIHLGATTLAACPPDSQADTFVMDLGRVASYVMDGDNLVLNLQLDSGNVVLQPRPQAQPQTQPSGGLPPGLRPLPTGVTWRIQSYNNGRGGDQTVLPDAQASATFGDDGVVSGDTGCNTFRGPYTTTDSSISFGLMVTTRRACLSDAANAQEQAILAALAASTIFELLGDRMTLRSADGTTQLLLLRPLAGQ